MAGFYADDEEAKYNNMPIDQLRTEFKRVFFEVYKLQNSPIWEEDQGPLLQARASLLLLWSATLSRRYDIGEDDKHEFELLCDNTETLIMFDPYKRSSTPLTADTEFQQVLQELGYRSDAETNKP